jgi:hypothetical protein
MSKIPTEKSIARKLLNDYKKQLRLFLLTSRFNTQTYTENETYRKNHENVGCIYCCPDLVSKLIPTDAIMFVLEMNNDINKIVGIGMVRNHAFTSKYSVYANGNYNRYTYIGKHRIQRDEMTEEEDQIMRVFDILCFTGNRHMKRGQGLKSFPVDILYKCNSKLDLVKFISEMFKKRINKNQKTISS